MPEVPIVYSNGPGAMHSYTKDSEGNCVRNNPKNHDISNLKYLSPGLIPRYEESHASDDVGLWAQGPLAFMFHTTHEQSYIGHVLAFTLCAGPYQDYEQHCSNWPRTSGFSKSSKIFTPVVIAVTIVIFAVGVGILIYFTKCRHMRRSNQCNDEEL